jgi:predicted RNase H-like HicB family nuclease
MNPTHVIRELGAWSTERRAEGRAKFAIGNYLSSKLLAPRSALFALIPSVRYPPCSSWRFPLTNEFTAIIERDGEWFIAYCPEIPGANGQGRTKQEARESLVQAIELILADRREDALRGIPPDAIRETVTVK